MCVDRRKTAEAVRNMITARSLSGAGSWPDPIGQRVRLAGRAIHSRPQCTAVKRDRAAGDPCTARRAAPGPHVCTFAREHKLRPVLPRAAAGAKAPATAVGPNPGPPSSFIQCTGSRLGVNNMFPAYGTTPSLRFPPRRGAPCAIPPLSLGPGCRWLPGYPILGRHASLFPGAGYRLGSAREALIPREPRGPFASHH